MTTDIDALFRAHEPKVFRFLCRVVGHADTAKDLTQDVFLRVAGGRMHTEALALEGQPVETAWPYSATDVVPWTPPAIASPMLRAQLSVGALSYPEIVAMLDRGRPVVLGLVVTDAFYRPDAAGLVEVRTPDPDRAGHAVLAVGYSGKSASDAALLIRNSWGAGWGSGGYGWLTKAYVERQLRETAVLT